MKQYTWILILAICAFGCGPPSPPMSIGNAWNCHMEQQWVSTKIANHLIGEWDWKFIECFWTPEDANRRDFKDWSIEFDSNLELVVKENGQVDQIATWRIVESHSGLFRLEVDPPVIFLYGDILICDNRIVFNDTPTDGCDNHFRKRD